MQIPSAHVFFTAVATGLLLGGLFAITALGLSLALGVMRLINLVHGELVVLGAYLGYELFAELGVDPLLGLFLVVPAVAAIAYPIQRLLLTPLMARGAEGPLLTTFGLSVILQNVFVLVFSGDTKAINTSYASDPLQIGSIAVPKIYAIAFVIALVVIAGTHLLVQRTALGREIRASAEDRAAASVLGVNVDEVFARTYALGAGTAAIGGVLVGLAFSFGPSTGTSYLLTGFAVVVLGGLGSVVGTLIGGVSLGVVESVGGSFFGDGYRTFIGLVVFLAILAFRPEGLLGRRRR
jgi:branched-chain amino acid transport system permease protein